VAIGTEKVAKAIALVKTAANCGAAIAGAVVSGGVLAGNAVAACGKVAAGGAWQTPYTLPFTAVRAPCLLRARTEPYRTLLPAQPSR
jgi:hypothetical protein